MGDEFIIICIFIKYWKIQTQETTAEQVIF